MTTITKEWLQQTIAEFENTRDDIPFGLDDDDAAMLQGAEPVSQTYELPQTQFEQVTDLYEMQFDDGRTCAFHTDGAKAAQWLLACDGNKVQEYVRIERYQEAVIGNSPVIPEGSFSGLVNSARALLDALYEFGADEVAISEYVTNLEDALRVAAAPEPEGLLKRNIREIEHIMDSCRATMLQANQRDLSQPVEP